MVMKMNFKLRILSLVLLPIFLLMSNISYAYMNYKDLSISHKDVGSSCMSTIDIRITKELGEKADYLVDYDYSNIRKDGVLMNVYYSNILGKSQWIDFPSPHNIYLMPTSIYLPIEGWLKNGVVADGSWWIRIVILNPKSCSK